MRLAMMVLIVLMASGLGAFYQVAPVAYVGLIVCGFGGGFMAAEWRARQLRP